MFKSLYGKLIAVLCGLTVMLAAMFLTIEHYTDIARRQEMSQRFFRALANQLVQEYVVPNRQDVDPEAFQAAFDRIHMINPRVDVYLLDDDGIILAASRRSGSLQRMAVNLGPIRSFLSGSARLPILGDDPRDPSMERVFSVAPITIAGETNGYLYLVIRGLRGQGITQQIVDSYVLREAVLLTAGGLILTLLAGMLIIKLITRPLRRLTLVMDKFRSSGFAEHAAPPRSASAGNGDEIDHLTDTFNRMADRMLAQMQELKETDAIRRELFANISHDLRTPLTALRGYLETLKIKAPELTPEERSSYLEVALRQSETLSTLVSELFELAKLERGKFELLREPFVLEDLIQDVVQEFELKAESRQVVLRADLPPELPLVNADIALIERVFRNLIENSLRYTPAGGAITVSAVPAAEHVTVRVADNGCGIDTEDLPHVFDRFYRGEKSYSDSSDSAGLGLAIVRRILELHGSSITVASTPGIETSMSFTLACAEAAEHVAAVERSGPVFEPHAPQRLAGVPLKAMAD
jgi:two-component system, OmpR family, sensor kinase